MSVAGQKGDGAAAGLGDSILSYCTFKPGGGLEFAAVKQKQTIH